MPRVFKIGAYWVFFYSNEQRPLEPIHVHVSKGGPHKNAPKIWITSRGRCLLARKQTEIPERVLRNIMDIIEARSDEIIEKWQDFFGEISFYC